MTQGLRFTEFPEEIVPPIPKRPINKRYNLICPPWKVPDNLIINGIDGLSNVARLLEDDIFTFNRPDPNVYLVTSPPVINRYQDHWYIEFTAIGFTLDERFKN